MHCGVLLALTVAAAFYLILFRTPLGYKFRVVGKSPRAANYSGFDRHLLPVASYLACFRHRTQVLDRYLAVLMRCTTRCRSGAVFAHMIYATTCGIVSDNPYRLWYRKQA